jgi:uncharacterized RDD family membrane protein YckC
MTEQSAPTEPSTPAWEPPEQVAGPGPGLAFAPHGSRLLSYIVDVLIVGAVVTALTVALAIPMAAMAGAQPQDTLTAPQGVLIALIVIAVLVVSLGYFPWFWARSGSTPGMRMTGLQVVRDTDGGPLTTGQALLRLVGYWVSSAVMYLGFIWIFIDSRHRGWHDLIAGTVVVKRI